MQCALCLSDAPLQNSHIIPEFLYRSLYDEKHRFHQLSIDDVQSTCYLQKGLREPLLCRACEQRLSVSERYTSMLLHGGIGIDIRQKNNRLYLSDVDYKKLKLFQLSVLWRAGVSSLSAFKQVQLGPHAELIRKMLFADDPGVASTYGCIMFSLMHEDEMLGDLILSPTWTRLNGQKAYRFIFGGLVFVFVVSGMQPSEMISSHFLQEDGTVIIKFQQAKELNFFIEAVERLNKSGKLDL